MPAVVVLAGPEILLQARRTREIREQLKERHGGVDLVRFDGATARPADVLDECRSFGLMVTHKLVVADNADQLLKEGARPLFERYAQAPSESATLVLRATKWNKGKFDEMVGEFVKCEAPAPSAAVGLAREFAGERNASLAPGAAEAIVERVGCDLGRIETEIAKLAAAADDGKGGPARITPELVSELTGRSGEEDLWAIQGTLLSGDRAAAVSHLRDLIVLSRQPAAGLSFAFLDLARKLHAISRGTREGVPPAVLGRALKLWGSSANAVMEVGRGVDPSRAHRLFRAAVEADVRFKSGLGDAARGLEVLALRFAALSASSRR